MSNVGKAYLLDQSTALQDFLSKPDPLAEGADGDPENPDGCVDVIDIPAMRRSVRDAMVDITDTTGTYYPNKDPKDFKTLKELKQELEKK